VSQFNGAVNSGPEATIVHEATHQLAYNTGLHSRMGGNPRWIVEGLATVFEAPGIRTASKNRTAASRINRGRFVQFRDFGAKRYKRKSLESYLASDKMFETNMSDAYAQAWAFSFFLIETRPREYGKLLKTIAARKPLSEYTAEQRVADFREIVADNLDLLEAEFRRYMQRIHEKGKKP
jgi:hypothetical protein